MPESGVLCLNEREVGWEEKQLSVKVHKDPAEKFHGSGSIDDLVDFQKLILAQGSSSHILNAAPRSPATGRLSLSMTALPLTRTVFPSP